MSEIEKKDTNYDLLVEGASLSKALEILKSELAKKDSIIDSLYDQIVVQSQLAALGQVSGEIAHEINNPLAIIMGRIDLLEMLAEDNLLTDKALIETTTKVRATVSRITTIIKGMKAFSKDHKLEDIRQIKASILAEDVKGLCQERFRSTGVALSIDIKPNDLMLDCNPIRISQVLLNLLNNSYDAISNTKDPWVKMVFSQDDHFNFIEVIDSGLGIPKVVAEKLLQPFFTTKKMGEGTGLGLSISRNIMTSHGGSLELVDATENTTFRLILPRKIIVR